jgi:hypothetical protein
MRPWSKSRWALTVLLLSVASCALFQRFGAGGPYKGRVIDAETKQPLEGAVVLAVWKKSFPAGVHRAYGFLDAEEVLTDKGGTFVVGKKPPISWIPGVSVEGPGITIFYPGYGFYPIYHTSPPRGIPPGIEVLLEQMEKEGLTFELPSLKTREERRKVVQHPVLLPSIPREKMPNLIRLLNIERKATGLPPV